MSLHESQYNCETGEEEHTDVSRVKALMPSGIVPSRLLVDRIKVLQYTSIRNITHGRDPQGTRCYSGTFPTAWPKYARQLLQSAETDRDGPTELVCCKMDITVACRTIAAQRQPSGFKIGKASIEVQNKT